MGGVLNASILLGLPFLLGLYTLSPETAALATTLVWIHDGFAMLLWPASFTLPNALRAAGDVRFTMSVSIFFHLGVPVRVRLSAGCADGHGRGRHLDRHAAGLGLPVRLLYHPVCPGQVEREKVI